MTYPNIDMIETGLKLKRYMDQAGMSVKDIQNTLHLSCPQPIYRWINGKVLPSVDHLLMLSELFDVHMEELLVKKQTISALYDIQQCNIQNIQERCVAYYKKNVSTSCIEQFVILKKNNYKTENY